MVSPGLCLIVDHSAGIVCINDYSARLNKGKFLRVKKGMISIVDYGMGNLRSVEKAFAEAGFAVHRIATAGDVGRAKKLVLPGVGAFGDAVRHLKRGGVDQALKDAAAAGVPLLGICLGAQLLFEGSEEDPEVAGLGILGGRVRRFPGGTGLKVPHMGWNSLDVKAGSKVLSGLGKSPFVYFVHSFYMEPDDVAVVAGETEYGFRFASAVERGNIAGVQFHPEKSQGLGLRILENFGRV